MTIKKFIYLAISFTAALTINSCGTKDTSISETKPRYINVPDKFHQICDSSNKLVFKRYDLGSDSNALQRLENVVWEDTITDSEKVEKFKNLFAPVKNGGYCCCMKTHYTVTLYKDNTELGLYYIDTTDIKDKIVLFGQSYNISYIIKLKDLNSIFKEN